jgi:hypothetical protein
VASFGWQAIFLTATEVYPARRGRLITTGEGGASMITAIVLYDLPPSIGLEECRAHFSKIAPDFLKAKGFLRKQFICRKEGGVAGGVYMWESEADAEAFYSGPWRAGIRARYGNDPKIQYFETVALTDKATGKAGAI